MDDEEFSFMVAKEVGQYDMKVKCDHCLKVTRGSIEDYFEYVDCDHDGYVESMNV